MSNVLIFAMLWVSFFALVGGASSFFLYRMWEQASLKNIVVAYVLPNKWFDTDKAEIMTMTEDELALLVASSQAPLNIRLLLGCPLCPKIHLSAFAYAVWSFPVLCALAVVASLRLITWEEVIMLSSVVVGCAPLSSMAAAGCAILLEPIEKQ